MCVVTGCVSRSAGGLFFSVRELSKALQATGEVEIEVWTVNDVHADEDVKAWNPLMVRRFAKSFPGKFGLSLPMVLAFQGKEFDLVHLHGLWGFTSVLAHLAEKRGIPVVVSPRGMLDPWILDRRIWLKRLYYKLFERQVITRSALVHVLSEAEAKAVGLLDLNLRIKQIPNGVHVPRNSEKRVMTSPKKIIYVGRYDEKKGVVEFLTAWAAVPYELRSGWRLELFGWGSDQYRVRLQKVIGELGISAECTVSGPVYGAEKDHVLRGASAFILPTKSEGLPMAVLEAWSYGLPVLTTEHANLPIGFSKGAAMNLGTTVDDFRLAIGSFLEFPQQKIEEMGRIAQELARCEFDWKRIADATLLAYRSVISSSSAL